MTSVQGIRRHGFRKWYERELLHSHANLVLLLLATIALLACAEVFTARLGLAEQAKIVASALASAAIGVFALRRYLYLLNHAEFVANQAECVRCKTYAKWTPIDEGSGEEVLRVRCRNCGNEWKITM